MIEIEPIKLGLKKKDGVYINVNPINVVLFADSCDSYWQILDIDNSIVDSGNLNIPSDVYLNWAEDDNIIIDYVVRELGLIRKVNYV